MNDPYSVDTEDTDKFLIALLFPSCFPCLQCLKHSLFIIECNKKRADGSSALSDPDVNGYLRAFTGS